MKKRFVSLFLACMFVFACALPAFAGVGFDESVLNNAKDIEHTENTDTDVGWYTVESTSDIWHDSQNDVGGVQTRINLEPDILISRKNSWEKFNLYLYVDRKGDTSIKVDNICFRIKNSKTYTDHYFYDPLVGSGKGQHDHKDGSSWMQDEFYIRLNKTSFAMMEDMIANRDGTVEIWISLDTSNEFIHCVDLSQDDIDGLIHLYNLYKQAGGLREENLTAIESGSTAYKAQKKQK